MTTLTIPKSLKLSAGEWVEIRSKMEILSTLDKSGRLDELPFMPQMFQYCGKRVMVAKRAHKLCDTVNGTGGRRMENAVLLEGLRCDGRVFGGCEMECLLFWKEAWLRRADEKPASEPALISTTTPIVTEAVTFANCTEADVLSATQVAREKTGLQEPVYVCQATQMPRASEKLSMWKVGQYVEDIQSGNAKLSQTVCSLLFLVYSSVAEAGLGFGWLFRSGYDAFQKLRGGSPYPERRGLLPKGSRTPVVNLNLQPGEFVRIKNHRQILETVDEGLINRGMAFHPTMVPYCGGTFRVLKRISKILNEKTGRIVQLKTECVVLEGADCVGRYTKPLACPRACYPYWREIWLERVAEQSTKPAADHSAKPEVA